MVYQFLFITLKNILSIVFSFTRHFAALWIRELENLIFDVTNRLYENAWYLIFTREGNYIFWLKTIFYNYFFLFTGMDDMPPLEGDAEDASRMEEVD